MHYKMMWDENWSNITKFKDEPHHPKAIKTLRGMMNQVVKLEWEQKFANLKDTEVMNISPESSPQKSESESHISEIDVIYGNTRYQHKQHRNWDNNRKRRFDNKWQSKARYNGYNNHNSKEGYHKSKFKNLRKDN